MSNFCVYIVEKHKDNKGRPVTDIKCYIPDSFYTIPKHCINKAIDLYNTAVRFSTNYAWSEFNSYCSNIEKWYGVEIDIFVSKIQDLCELKQH